MRPEEGGPGSLPPVAGGSESQVGPGLACAVAEGRLVGLSPPPPRGDPPAHGLGHVLWAQKSLCES